MICVSLVASTAEEILQQAEGLQEADLLEIRLDALEEPRVAPFLEKIRRPLLFTFRAREEGGLREAPLAKRLACLQEAAQGGAWGVDLELAAGKEAIEALRRTCQGTKLLLSFHDFEGVPPLSRLKELVEEMKRLGADWGKVVVTVGQAAEALPILSLIPWARKELAFPLTAFAMGPEGKYSRLVCLLLGAPLTYAAPPGGVAAAPGQLPCDKLRQAWELFAP